jgi:hypothetical protein
MKRRAFRTLAWAARPFPHVSLIVALAAINTYSAGASAQSMATAISIPDLAASTNFIMYRGDGRNYDSQGQLVVYGLEGSEFVGRITCTRHFAPEHLTHVADLATLFEAPIDAKVTVAGMVIGRSSFAGIVAPLLTMRRTAAPADGRPPSVDYYGRGIVIGGGSDIVSNQTMWFKTPAGEISLSNTYPHSEWFLSTSAGEASFVSGPISEVFNFLEQRTGAICERVIKSPTSPPPDTESIKKAFASMFAGQMQRLIGLAYCEGIAKSTAQTRDRAICDVILAEFIKGAPLRPP